ncbi:uncharacterized protein STEHIDRAFT_125761 [Stereum hirsutum FP-91666 SS1]|uniref:uncharacterized protein n=1 Tax=Stereum hirsutum (strain FP-91666) TaxID=721885 RepID=UPI0004449342|nr:uncharacterized protein STEHIDRAFT_125761 [Stereum hirsutum FP-91666 SS1]EIM80753.1 hypothetical protein STEHIDRAFT_125761 [Stereum hirsutum FP-91666 SS1]
MNDSRIPVVQASPTEGSSSLRRTSNRPPDVSSTGRTNGEEYRVDAGYRPISESCFVGA